MASVDGDPSRDLPAAEPNPCRSSPAAPPSRSAPAPSAPLLTRSLAGAGRPIRHPRAAAEWPTPLADGESESHGLSAFGELALPADFAHLPYADPDAPKGGTIVLEPTTAGLNQNFTTFDTLNIYILRGVTARPA